MDGKGVGHRVDPPVTAETLRQVDSLFESAGFSPGLPAGFGSRLKRSEKTDLFFRLQAGPSITGAQFLTGYSGKPAPPASTSEPTLLTLNAFRSSERRRWSSCALRGSCSVLSFVSARTRICFQ